MEPDYIMIESDEDIDDDSGDGEGKGDEDMEEEKGSVEEEGYAIGQVNTSMFDNVLQCSIVFDSHQNNKYFDICICIFLVS